MTEEQTPEPEVPARPELKATVRLGQNSLNAILIVVILMIMLPLLFLGYRVALNFKAKRDITIAESNMHALYVALSHYSLDWDGKLPAAENWTDAAAGYLPSASGIVGGKIGYLKGPGDDGDIAYVFNSAASGFNLQDERNRKVDPSRIVLLIEKPGAAPNAHTEIPAQMDAQAEDALYKMLAFPHYADDPSNATTIILYANGTVAVRTRKDYRQR
jgi:hypothetical protein